MLSRAILLLLLLPVSILSQPAETGIPFEGQANAPEFPSSVEWLNTGRPLTLSELRGKVVLLDFWGHW